MAKHGLIKQLLALLKNLHPKLTKEELVQQLVARPAPRLQVAELVLLVVPKHRADPRQEAEVDHQTQDIQPETIFSELLLLNKKLQIQPLLP
jgi:hypothetical protein